MDHAARPDAQRPGQTASIVCSGLGIFGVCFLFALANETSQLYPSAVPGFGNLVGMVVEPSACSRCDRKESPVLCGSRRHFQPDIPSRIVSVAPGSYLRQNLSP